MKRAFSIKWIDALAEGAGNLAFDRPEIRRCIGTSPIGRRGVLGESKRDADARRAAQGSALQRIKLIKRRIDLGGLNLFGRSGHHCRIGFQAIKRGDLAGERAQGSYLNVAFLGHLLQLGISIF